MIIEHKFLSLLRNIPLVLPVGDTDKIQVLGQGQAVRHIELALSQHAYYSAVFGVLQYSAVTVSAKVTSLSVGMYINEHLIFSSWFTRNNFCTEMFYTCTFVKGCIYLITCDGSVYRYTIISIYLFLSFIFGSFL